MDDINFITDSMVEAISEKGNAMPRAHIVGRKGTTVVMFADFPGEFKEREKLFFGLGAKYGEDIYPTVGELQGIYFGAEIYMSKQPVEKDGTYIMPSKDPNRTDGLMVIGMDLTKNEEYFNAFEVHKDRTTTKVHNVTKPIDQDAPDGAKLESPLMDAFFAGYSLGKKNSKPEVVKN